MPTYQITAKENIDAGTAVESGTGYSLQLTEADTSAGEIDFTNTYAETVDVEVTKDWADMDNLPAESSVTVVLSAKVGLADYDLNRSDLEQTISASTTPNAWKYTWKDLPKKNDQGDLITYSVTETGITVAGAAIAQEDLSSYIIEADTADTAYNFFLKNQIPTLTKKALKQWSQNTLPVGTSVTFKITATTQTFTDDIFGNLTGVTGDQEQTLSGTDAMVTANWEAQWSNLPKYYYGEEIRYTIAEIAITVAGTEIWTSTSGEDNPLLTETTSNAEYTAIFTNELPEIEVTLPSTGGNGTMRLLLVGIGLILIATIGLYINRRRVYR